RPHRNKYAVLGGRRIRCHQGGERDAARYQGRRGCRAGHPCRRGRRDHLSDEASRLVQVRSRGVGDPTHRPLSLRTVEIAGSLTGSIADSKVRKPGWWFGRIKGMIACPGDRSAIRSEEHTSELQSLTNL